MADITNSKAVKLSNEIARVGAERIVNTYYRLSRLHADWMAAGNDATALTVMLLNLRTEADRLRSLYEWCFSQSNTLSVIGGTELNSLLPRDASPVIDGSVSDGRLRIVSQDVRRVFDRIDWLEGWLRLDAATGLISDWVRLRTVLLVTTIADRDLTLNQTRNFVIDRVTELKTELETNNNQKRDWLLKVAVNVKA